MPDLMQAATARRYGGPEVMAIETLPRPVPGPGQLLIRVGAFGVTRGDARIRGLDVPRGMGPMLRLMFGLTRPRQPVLGREFAGVVAGIGSDVTGWSEGTAVMGITDGMRMGAGAEYCVVSADKLVLPRPESLTAPEAAGYFFGILTAADFLIDQCGLQPGERLLVNGATGAVGAPAVWLGTHLGAEVTATCSTPNHAFAQSMGAAHVHDYRNGLPAGPVDVIFDIPGTLPYAVARPIMSDNGRLAMATADLLPQLGAALRPRRGQHRLAAGIVKETRDALTRALSYHAQGYRPEIVTFPLAEVVEAHRLASSGHKPGNVVVTV
ncbi:NAD(P)-dependent alcohol dehydrogenase [Pararhodobacter sp. CCB-MM2]|uniref:NAD(P)-dependent alcohol dehydrogenase n=1 Tax=Pararhodobacter sp. CCB-MM2 TaxID=1786003 RepID=UPI0013140981|nr:NAD(P)-dependent alcohol dehydrogenase [Pararhodobacter sp. CCB-MM2]